MGDEFKPERGTVIIVDLDTDHPEKAVVIDALTKAETQACMMSGQLVKALLFSTKEIIERTYGWAIEEAPSEEDQTMAEQLYKNWDRIKVD